MRPPAGRAPRQVAVARRWQSGAGGPPMVRSTPRRHPSFLGAVPMTPILSGSGTGDAHPLGDCSRDVHGAAASSVPWGVLARAPCGARRHWWRRPGPAPSTISRFAAARLLLPPAATVEQSCRRLDLHPRHADPANATPTRILARHGQGSWRGASFPVGCLGELLDSAPGSGSRCGSDPPDPHLICA
jgi:hypothetical protein